MSAMTETPEQKTTRGSEQQAFERRRKQRNIALLVALLAFAVLIYVITLVKLDGTTGVG